MLHRGMAWCRTRIVVAICISATPYWVVCAHTCIHLHDNLPDGYSRRKARAGCGQAVGCAEFLSGEVDVAHRFGGFRVRVQRAGLTGDLLIGSASCIVVSTCRIAIESLDRALLDLSTSSHVCCSASCGLHGLAGVCRVRYVLADLPWPVDRGASGQTYSNKRQADDIPEITIRDSRAQKRRSRQRQKRILGISALTRNPAETEAEDVVHA